MIKEQILINGIPAILWGNDSTKIIIAVHGNLSSKEDIPITLLAEHAVPLGYQVLSFDLPEHGDRKNSPTLCKVENCISDLKNVLEFARMKSNTISLWANSIGAYFSLLAYQDEPLKKSLFLSPVVDMSRMIQNMMCWFDVTEEQLYEKKEILTPIGQTLYWDYYQYVIENPIIKWNAPTSILYGRKDELCEYDRLAAFITRFNCSLTISDFSEHYFHTEEDLTAYRKWLAENI
ncbi:alpha/beta hydrolase [Sinanaerobacter sp. ZZT-01]|uniref:alpha/beta hydrolase n=1 Tax=Sinanaerobacter sp. ZZT-01 TaxID=3111540 RepID=UPI002D78A8EB|nr:alpha/beta hydrolase [Sinanaerobacter sp. ZZT-01]WRR93725.1 alpha/beta hydrolase [Sinanaerobacter sp. ZZT-01]